MSIVAGIWCKVLVPHVLELRSTGLGNTIIHGSMLRVNHKHSIDSSQPLIHQINYI